MNTEPGIRSPHTPQDIDKLEATIANLRHEAYAYKRQRDRLSVAMRDLLHANIVRADDVIEKAEAALREIYGPSTQ